MTCRRPRTRSAKCGQPNGFATNIGLPLRPAEGEGDGRADAAVAGQGRHQADAQAATRPATTSSSTPASPTSPRRNNLGLIMTNGWGADWPDGFGFLQPDRRQPAIRPGGGNYNLGSQGPRGRRADRQGARRRTTRPRARPGLGRDRQEGHGGRVIVPAVWAKGLLYRPPTLTNVFVNAGLRHVRLRRRSASSSSRRPAAPAEGGEGTAAVPRRRRGTAAPRPTAVITYIIRRLISGRAAAASSSARSPSRSSSWCRGWPARPRTTSRRRYVGKSRRPGADPRGQADKLGLDRSDLRAVRPLRQGHRRRRRLRHGDRGRRTARRPASATPSSPRTRSARHPRPVAGDHLARPGGGVPVAGRRRRHRRHLRATQAGASSTAAVDGRSRWPASRCRSSSPACCRCRSSATAWHGSPAAARTCRSQSQPGPVGLRT